MPASSRIGRPAASGDTGRNRVSKAKSSFRAFRSLDCRIDPLRPPPALRETGSTIEWDRWAHQRNEGWKGWPEGSSAVRNRSPGPLLSRLRPGMKAGARFAHVDGLLPASVDDRLLRA